MKKSGRLPQHGGVGAHAAARLVDAPALARGIARPHERHRAPLVRRGAEASDQRLAHHRREGVILEPHAVEDVLSGRQAFDQRLGGEIGFGERVDRDRAANALEAVGGRGLDQHARRPVGARPHHAGIGRDVTRLNTMGDDRPIRDAAERRLGDAAGDGDRRRRSRSREKAPPRQSAFSKSGCRFCVRTRVTFEGARAWKARSCAASERDGHVASAVESMRRTMAVVSDRDSTL